jgi:hypothetical protein
VKNTTSFLLLRRFGFSDFENNPRISHLVFDHTSILKLIEWRWRLAPLTPRDASTDIANLALALDFNQPVIAIPTLPKPHVPFFPDPCFQTLFGEPLWHRESDRNYHFSCDRQAPGSFGKNWGNGPSSTRSSKESESLHLKSLTGVRGFIPPAQVHFP